MKTSEVLDIIFLAAQTRVDEINKQYGRGQIQAVNDRLVLRREIMGDLSDVLYAASHVIEKKENERHP